MKRPFPPDLPRSLGDRDAIVANDWDAFLALDTVENHWDRKPWPAGARHLYWYLTFEGNSDLTHLARACQQGIADLRYDAVPDDALHLTMLRVGSAEDLAGPPLERVLKRAEASCAHIEPFEIELGPLSGSAGAARLSVSPWSDLDRLHQALFEATTADLEPTERPPFRPHVGVAYGNRHRPAREVHTLIAEQRTRATVHVAVSDVHLVELRREGRAYKWEPVASVQLRGPAAPVPFSR
ncbi:2'-5' RNA ligase family protein [Nocardioides speluncae]|uniref:2'-5' RNA ligase family protein n=1 Tax=Nocardioides speluncae TaxID=2670337 RepID=UPI000D68DFBA|nr:2'-5' RNA ligase family protein [Nocardioides speluncae]